MGIIILKGIAWFCVIVLVVAALIAEGSDGKMNDRED